MKVYELMKRLEEMPAGADVLVRCIKSENEINKINVDDEEYFEIEDEVAEVEDVLGKVILYGN